MWEDIKKQLKWTALWGQDPMGTATKAPEQIMALNQTLVDSLGNLLADAEALLVLRGGLRRISHMIDSGGVWEAADAAVMQEIAETHLAALPAHLREQGG